MPKSKTPPPAYVGFGMLTPVHIMVIDRLPKHNTGAIVREVSDFVFDDAAIIACALRQWDIPTGMIGSAVGDDPRGHALAAQLKEWGVQGKVHFTNEYSTPIEVDVSDKTGARTYFWQRSPEILATLDTANLSLLKDAQLMYVDWYDGGHIMRAIEEANRLHLPVFLNLEHAHKHAQLLKQYAGKVTICQAVTDAAQLGGKEDMVAVAKKLLKAGIQTAIITLASEGCLAVQGDTILRVYAPKVKAVDGCGAGATFSSGFIYGYLKGWDLEQSTRFAVAAASLKVTRPGLTMFPVSEIASMASKLRVEHMVFRDNRFVKIRPLLSLPQKDRAGEGRKLARIATERLLPQKKTDDKLVSHSSVKKKLYR
jgi:ribokinase